MSAEDWTQHNPWRAPGAAPVQDVCGMAGGGLLWKPTQLSFIDTQHAKQGDRGSIVLPYTPTGVVWYAIARILPSNSLVSFLAFLTKCVPK